MMVLQKWTAVRPLTRVVPRELFALVPGWGEGFLFSGMAIHLRQAGSSDLDAIVKLWRELADFHAELDPRYRLNQDAEREIRNAYARWLRDPAWRIILAEQDGQPVGFIAATIHDAAPVLPERVHGYISDAAVTAGQRGKGIGELLCREVERWFAGRDIRIVELNAAATNPISTGFWHKMGYADFSMRMRKELP